MAVPTRLVSLVVLAAVLAVGCSKPVSPDAGLTGSFAKVPAGLAGAATAPIPEPYVVRLEFTGPVVSLDEAGRPALDRNERFFVLSTGAPPGPLGFVPDTVPAHARLKLAHWKRTSGPASAAPFTSVPELEPAVPDFGGPASDLPPGTHVYRLKVPQQIGGGWIWVTFHVGFAPGAWWAGPDPARFPPSSDGDGRAVDVLDWGRFATHPAWPPDGRAYFGPDSFRFVPSRRAPVGGDLERRTFYEIFGDRIWARTEGDTVHQGAWVVLVNGGFDRDSRYEPMVDPTDPALPAGHAADPDRYAALVPQGLIGTPTAFRSEVTVRLANGNLVRPALSSPYPNFIPTSVFRTPRLAGYARMNWPGKAYATVHAQDADGLLSRRLADEIGAVDRVDAGAGTPQERQFRRQVVTFHVRPVASAGTRVAAGD